MEGSRNLLGTYQVLVRADSGWHHLLNVPALDEEDARAQAAPYVPKERAGKPVKVVEQVPWR